MDKILSLGKYLYAGPIAVFGVMHIVSADIMASATPGGIMMVYITGIALIAASISIFIEKLDKLACILLGILFLLFIIPHAANVFSDKMEVVNILKNIALAGGAFMCATISKDSSYIK